MLHATNSKKPSHQAARLLLAAVVLAVLAAPAVAQTDKPKTNTKPLESLFKPTPATAPPSQLAPPNAKMTSEQTIAEIEQLRQRMGGGVGERLKGILPGVDPDEKFRQQLENLTREPKSSRPVKPPVAQTPFEAAMSTQPLFSNVPPRLPPPPFYQPSQQEVLRTSAADLERIAANMEAAKLYKQADQLREAAESFWQKARDLD